MGRPRRGKGKNDTDQSSSTTTSSKQIANAQDNSIPTINSQSTIAPTAISNLELQDQSTSLSPPDVSVHTQPESPPSEKYELSNTKPVSHTEFPSKGPPKYGLLAYLRIAAIRKRLDSFNATYTPISDLVLSSIGYSSLLASTLLDKRQAPLATSLGRLSALISDYRTGWRVVATPATLLWALNVLAEAPSEPNTWLRASSIIQALSGVAYQLLEDLAYLASKGVVRMSSDAQEVVWAISSATWAVHVFLELAKALASIVTRANIDKVQLLTNIAWAPLTVHWSTRKGLFGSKVVGLFGSLATVPRLLVATMH